MHSVFISESPLHFLSFALQRISRFLFPLSFSSTSAHHCCPYSQAQVPTFKCVLIGDGAVGKTTFVKRHLTGEFEKKYIGIRLCQFAYDLTFDTSSFRKEFRCKSLLFPIAFDLSPPFFSHHRCRGSPAQIHDQLRSYLLQRLGHCWSGEVRRSP